MQLAFILLFIIVICSVSFADRNDLQTKLDSLRRSVDSLRVEIEKMKESEAQSELDELKKNAMKASESAVKESQKLKSKTFREGSRSLQALNPEISATGDMLSKYLFKSPHYTEEERSGFQFRVFEVAFQSNLDPFSMAKAILEFNPREIALAEAYVTWLGLFPRINLTAGKFRQQFGVVNRWHAHALDQVAFPLPIQLFMGEEGLNQIGFSLEWLMPSFTAHANEFILQITNSSNEALFGGEEFSLPAVLGRFKNFYDLNPSTYFEIGFTGLAGTNDSLGFTFDQSHRWTYMGGIDVTLSWIPIKKALYRGFLWRTEFYYLNKELPVSEKIKAWGSYSYLDYRLNRRWIIGVRGDIAQPPTARNNDQYLWQLVPYLTFWQSEFVYLRLQFSHLQGHNLETEDNRLTFQIDWSLGPHKHERY
jgi:hypothetical protein